MGEEQQLGGDEISAGMSQLNQEIGREEGHGSWDRFEIDPEENATSEIESGQETEESEPESTRDDTPEEEEAPEEEEETEQKNTLQGEPNRVLSFKDFFNRD